MSLNNGAMSLNNDVMSLNNGVKRLFSNLLINQLRLIKKMCRQLLFSKRRNLIFDFSTKIFQLLLNLKIFKLWGIDLKNPNQSLDSFSQFRTFNLRKNIFYILKDSRF